MMPASRAAWRGSPFFTAPVRINRRAVADMLTVPRATASRAVTAFSPTSTILIRPRASTCDNRGPPSPRLRRAGPRLVAIVDTLREVEREAFERDGQIHALQLHGLRHLQRAGREIENRL